MPPVATHRKNSSADDRFPSSETISAYVIKARSANDNDTGWASGPRAFPDAACLLRGPRIAATAAGGATSAAVGPGRPSDHTISPPRRRTPSCPCGVGLRLSAPGRSAIGFPRHGPGRSGRSPLPKAACSACPVTSNPRQPASSARCAARTSCVLGTSPLHRPADLLPGRGQRGSSFSCGQRADLAGLLRAARPRCRVHARLAHLDAAAISRHLQRSCPAS